MRHQSRAWPSLLRLISWSVVLAMDLFCFTGSRRAPMSVASGKTTHQRTNPLLYYQTFPPHRHIKILPCYKTPLRTPRRTPPRKPLHTQRQRRQPQRPVAYFVGRVGRAEWADPRALPCKQVPPLVYHQRKPTGVDHHGPNYYCDCRHCPWRHGGVRRRRGCPGHLRNARLAPPSQSTVPTLERGRESFR